MSENKNIIILFHLVRLRVNNCIFNDIQEQNDSYFNKVGSTVIRQANKYGYIYRGHCQIFLSFLFSLVIAGTYLFSNSIRKLSGKVMRSVSNNEINSNKQLLTVSRGKCFHILGIMQNSFSFQLLSSFQNFYHI